MAIQTIQLNTPDTSQKKTVKSYRDAKKPVKTNEYIKPLPPQGHLVDDNLATGTKYFFKDIGYDMKSLKNGYKGTANDHQLGRLNDVGLRLGGICIATYLASQTSNPKTRLMEYIGLAVFLTSMAIYPKIAINTPAKILHGYDIDKEYIDDQGRKKSVHQDSNYIPYDMYNGKNKEEDLDYIGDKMGIPRDIKNRHDVIREQMRKIATQNNTLWMLTAGLATPLMTALLCSGIEKFIVSPSLEKARNLKYDSEISSLLKKATSETTDFNTVNNALGDSIKRIITKYENKTLPPEEAEKIKELLCSKTDSTLACGIKLDLEKMLSGKNIYTINENMLNSTFDQAIKAMSGRQIRYISENILPTQAEIISMINEIKPNTDLKNGVELSSKEYETLQQKIYDTTVKRIENATGNAAKHKDFIISNVFKFQEAFEFKNTPILTKESGEKLIKYANILGDFKKKLDILDKCENFKFEYAPETILANYYENFQKTLIKQLGISPKDYNRISNDETFAKELLDQKFTELCKNETKYKETFEKLGKILSDMESALNGKGGSESHIIDLINAIEKVYHNTANALNECNLGKNTVNLLVKSSEPNIINSKEELYKLLDGINSLPQIEEGTTPEEISRIFAGSKGSSKSIKISRLLNRYQGENNSFFRILQTLDFYKTALDANKMAERVSVKNTDYVQRLVTKVKEALLSGDISDFILKLRIENANEYRDFYNLGWALEGNNYGELTQKGIITEQTKEALNKYKNANIAERLQTYITRFKNIIANDSTDFARQNHTLDVNIPSKYTDFAKTNEAKFNLVAQKPLDMIRKGTSKMHSDRIWLKSVGIFTAAVFGVTIAAQFLFGKIKNKHNLQKIDNKKTQVAYDTNK